jgi:hypothetical protein
MGDSKITLHIIPSDSFSILRLSADASLHDLVKQIQSIFYANPTVRISIPGYPISSFMKIGGIPIFPIVILDCTLYPPRDITEIIETYNEPEGPKAMTLFHMGWYPSAELLILNDGPNNNMLKADFLEGRRKLFHTELPSSTKPADTPASNTLVSQRPCPSQVLVQATNPHRRTMDPPVLTQTDSLSSTASKRNNNKTCARIGSCLYTWDHEKQTLLPLSPPAFSPSSATSTNPKKDRAMQQVLKIKIKSQCNMIYKNLMSCLRDEDRFLLETIVVYPDRPTSSNSSSNHNPIDSRFMVFSRHSTMAKVMSDIVQDWNVIVPDTCTADIYKLPHKGIITETNQGNVKLPLLQRLYELEGSKILSPYETVFVYVHSIS